MRMRIVAVDCGISRYVVGAFVPTADGELMLEECALLPRGEALAAAVWPELPATLRRASRYAVAPLANQTIAKTITVPRVSRAKRARIVRFEAERAIPRPLAEVAWDWTTPATDAGTVELAAMKLEVAEALAAAAEAGGTRLDAIVPRAMALALAVRHNYPETRGPIAVVEVEGSVALLVLTGGGRNVARLVGLPERAPVAAAIAEKAGDGSEPELRLIRLAAEVNRLCEGGAAAEEKPEPPVVLLAGPDAPEPEECRRVFGESGPRVETLDALRRVRLGKRASGAAVPAHDLGVAVGTALAARARNAPNLLPPARRRENAFRRSRVWWLAAGCALVALLAGTGFRMRREAARERAAAAAIAREMEPWRAAQREALERQRQLDACRRELGVLDGLECARTSWVRFLDDTQARLARAGGVWLDTLQLLPTSDAGATGGSGTLFGHAPATDASGRVVRLRLAITGCALDPGIDGRRGLERVRELLRDWATAETVAAVEAERFDAGEPGLLRFGCVLVLKPEAGL